MKAKFSIFVNTMLRAIVLLVSNPRIFKEKLISYITKKEKTDIPIALDKIVLYTEVTTHCTNKCSFCPIGRGKVNRDGYINIDVECKVKNFIESNPKFLFKVFFHAVGESLLYNGLEEYIKLLTPLPNAEIWVATNGVLLDDKRLYSLYNAGLHNIWFSMFYTEENEYKKHTKTDNFFIAKSNLYNLLSKNELFKNVNIVTFSENADEIKRIIIDKKNVTLQQNRVITEWEYVPGNKPNYFNISFDGAVSFYYQDYNFSNSIGNICTFPPVELMAKYLNSGVDLSSL